MNVTLHLLIAAIASVIAVHWVFLRILKIAKVKGIVDNPNARKLQKSPVPVLGGIAVFFGLIAGLLAYYFCEYNIDNLINSRQVPILLGASVMLYVGSLDDILGLSPRSRLIIETLVMLGIIYGSGLCVDSLHGLWGIYQFSWWIAIPLTVFAGVGLINAYNMVDGVNGLSSGLCILCSTLLAIICWLRCDFSNCAIAICFAGSLVPFLLHNVFGKRSKMFIGDGGTMVMGFLVTWFVIRVLSSDNAETLMRLAKGTHEMGLVAMMTAIASVPVFDTLRVMAGRISHGRSPFRADRTHLHHVFIDMGISHSITALSEIVINLIIVAIWFISYRLGLALETQLYIVVSAALFLVWGMYFFLSRYVSTHPNVTGFSWVKRTHLGHRQWWISFQNWLDRGAYEDYANILHEKLQKPLEELDEDEKDTAAIVNYLQSKRLVKIEDIMNNSGANPQNVLLILRQLEREGAFVSIKTDVKGNYFAVRLEQAWGGR